MIAIGLFFSLAFLLPNVQCMGLSALNLVPEGTLIRRGSSGSFMTEDLTDEDDYFIVPLIPEEPNNELNDLPFSLWIESAMQGVQYACNAHITNNNSVAQLELIAIPNHVKFQARSFASRDMFIRRESVDGASQMHLPYSRYVEILHQQYIMESRQIAVDAGTLNLIFQAEQRHECIGHLHALFDTRRLDSVWLQDFAGVSNTAQFLQTFQRDLYEGTVALNFHAREWVGEAKKVTDVITAAQNVIEDVLVASVFRSVPEEFSIDPILSTSIAPFLHEYVWTLSYYDYQHGLFPFNEMALLQASPSNPIQIRAPFYATFESTVTSAGESLSATSSLNSFNSIGSKLDIRENVLESDAKTHTRPVDVPVTLSRRIRERQQNFIHRRKVIGGANFSPLLNQFFDNLQSILHWIAPSFEFEIQFGQSAWPNLSKRLARRTAQKFRAALSLIFYTPKNVRVTVPI